MAVEGEMPPEQEQETEYESDPDDALLPSAMRRREASDDEEGDRSDGAERRRSPVRVGVASDGESDGQGGAPGYDDEEEVEDDEEEEDDLLDDEEYEEEERDVGGKEEARIQKVVNEEFLGGEGRSGGDENGGDHHSADENNQAREEKKENEPFAVPTAGAFYMHDDRFRESRGGRHRRTRDGRKLWESKDDRTWVHDRFEEMSVQDRHYNEERKSYRGRNRGRGRSRVIGRGFGRGNRSRAYEEQPREQNDRQQAYDDRSQAYEEQPRAHNDRRQAYEDRSRAHDNRYESSGVKKGQNNAPKAVRGRGPRRYDSLSASNSNMELPATRNKQVGKSNEPQPTSSNSAGRQSSQASSAQKEPVVPRKQVFASSLNSASPPFYPSGSSSQDPSITANRDVQTGNANRNVSSTTLDDNFSPSNSSASMRGKTAVDYVGQERLQIDNSHRHLSGNPMPTNLQMQSSSSSFSSSISTSQSPHLRVQARTLSQSGGQHGYQQNSFPNQVGRISASSQLTAVPKRPVQAPVQPILLASAPQLGPHPSGGAFVSTSLQGQSSNASEPGESESPTGSSKSKDIASKEKSSSQGGGRGTFLYNGPTFVGANGTLGLSQGDQNFPGTPALLPVMHFNGQPHSGLGVPAVGMALPGYVAQPQLGFGSSDMAWLPMLAGAAGALGASYGPYIALDSGYHARLSGQTSSSAPSKEAGTAKPASTWKTPQRSESETDEYGQRQNKPRRYSEMNFGQ